MKVYVLLGNWDYEGSRALGVYRSRLSAEQGRDAYIGMADAQGFGRYDSYDIEEFELHGDEIKNPSPAQE